MNPSYVILFKTHFWDDFAERRLKFILDMQPAATVFVLFDDTSNPCPDIPYNRVVYNESTFAGLGLPVHPEGQVLWFNCDYPLYLALRLPCDFQYFAMIEYDAVCNRDISDIVKRMDDAGWDALGVPIEAWCTDQNAGTTTQQWCWYSTCRDAYDRFFSRWMSFTIFSRRALEFLFERRKELANKFARKQIKNWPIWEAFVPTELMLSDKFKFGSLSEFGRCDFFGPWPPQHEDDLPSLHEQGFVHPVLDEGRYISSILRADPADYFVSDSLVRSKLDRCRPENVLPALAAAMNRKSSNKDAATPKSTTPETMIKLRLLLRGGHVYETTCSRDAALLGQLNEALLFGGTSPGSMPRLIQLEIDDNGRKRGLGLLSSMIVAVESDPLVTFVPAPIPVTIEKVHYIRIPDFLSADENQRVLEYAVANQSKFEPSKVDSGLPGYRESRVIYRIEDLGFDFTARIREIVPDVLRHWNMKEPEQMTIETQMTTHNEGGYFKAHNDNGSPSTAARMATYVYYFHRQPAAFSGGKLRLYDSKNVNNVWIAGDPSVDIEPANNALLLFPSKLMHEVLPTICPSGDFGDGRFTINGWIRDAAKTNQPPDLMAASETVIP